MARHLQARLCASGEKKKIKRKKKGKPCICWRCQSPASLEPPEHHQQLFQLLKPLTIKSCFSQGITVSESLPLPHKGVIHECCSSVQTALEKYRPRKCWEKNPGMLAGAAYTLQVKTCQQHHGVLQWSGDSSPQGHCRAHQGAQG